VTPPDHAPAVHAAGGRWAAADGMLGGAPGHRLAR
jgi:hypothetical protein